MIIGGVFTYLAANCYRYLFEESVSPPKSIQKGWFGRSPSAAEPSLESYRTPVHAVLLRFKKR
jgi:hypothetical protein